MALIYRGENIDHIIKDIFTFVVVSDQTNDYLRVRGVYTDLIAAQKLADGRYDRIQVWSDGKQLGFYYETISGEWLYASK